MHQIRREKRTISEMIVRGKQNRNWFYFKFSVESSSFILQTSLSSLSFVWFYQSAFLSKFVAFHPRTVKQIVTPALMPSLLFHCIPLFLPHLRTLAQEKGRKIVFVLGLVGRVSVCIHYCRTNICRSCEKNSSEAICSRYQTLSGSCQVHKLL